MTGSNSNTMAGSINTRTVIIIITNTYSDSKITMINSDYHTVISDNNIIATDISVTNIGYNIIAHNIIATNKYATNNATILRLLLLRIILRSCFYGPLAHVSWV